MPRVVLSVTLASQRSDTTINHTAFLRHPRQARSDEASSINICQGVSAVQNSFLTHSSTPDASHCIPGLYNPAWLSVRRNRRTDLTAKYQPGRYGPLKFPYMYRKRARVHLVGTSAKKGELGIVTFGNHRYANG